MKTILYVKPSHHSFIRKDELFLSENYRTHSFLYQFGNWIRHFTSHLKLILWLSKNISAADTLFVWFADYHSWLPILFSRIFQKDSVVIVGGYDVACLPEYDYGTFIRKFRGWCSKYTLRNAVHVLPVAENLEREMRVRVGTVRGKVQVVPTGYDPDQWTPGDQGKTSMVLTVGMAETLSRMKIKGLDWFAEVAREMPEIPFVIVGVKGKAGLFLRSMNIQNLTLVGEILPAQLVGYYRTSGIYAQLSIREGLPNALCEAMLCECIPVGTRVGAIPEIIGESGFLISGTEKREVMTQIQRALQQKVDFGKKARQRIIELYSDKKRWEYLRKILD